MRIKGRANLIWTVGLVAESVLLVLD
jgi:hypothetical protein